MKHEEVMLHWSDQASILSYSELVLCCLFSRTTDALLLLKNS